MLYHKKITTYFDKVIANGKLSHAYLFVGPQGVGKFTFAKELAAKIINCQLSIVNCHPDIFVIEKEEQKKLIGISEARAAFHFLSLRPTSGFRILIIKDADALTLEAQNAFLKIIEEPPKNSLEIFCTDKEKKILPTLKSRCQRIDFRPFSVQEISDYLIKNFGTERKTAEKIARLSLGRINRAQNLKDNFSAYKKDLRYFLEIFDADLGRRFALVEEIAKDQAKLKYFFEEVIIFLRESILNNTRLNTRFNTRLLRKFLELQKLIENTNVNPRLQLENFVLSCI